VEEEEEQVQDVEEKGIYEFLNEIFDLIDEGYHETPRWDKKLEKLYLYNKIGQSKSFDLSSFSREEQMRIHEKAKEYARKRREELKEEEKLRKLKQQKELKEESKRGNKAKSKKSDYQQAGTGRRITLEELDRSHAKIVKHITERVGWFADVLNEVGFYATLIAMQYAKVPINEIYDRIVDFSDPYEFVDFVRTNLNALFEAKEEARAIVELRKKVDALELKAIALEEIINELKNQRDQATLALYAAVSTMDEDQLRQFIMNLMVAQFGLGVKMPNIYNMNVGGVSGGTGGVVSEGNSEEEGDTTGAGTTAS